MISARPMILGACFSTIVAGVAVAQRPQTLVVAAPVVEREVTAGQTFVGTVMPSKRAVIGSAVDGRVVEFPLNEGDRVESGQKLAQLLTETIKLELAAAEAELDFRKEQLAEMENGTRKLEVEQLAARLAAAEAKMNFLESRRARTERAYNNGRAASEDELEAAVSAAVEARQSHLDAKAAYDLAVEGPRPEAIAQARAQVAVQQAVVDKLRDQIGKHTIATRFDGYIVAEHTEEGQWVKQGDPVAEVAALDVVEVAVQVVEENIPFVQLDEEVRVEIPALRDRLFSGKVVEIVPQADVRARTFPVRVRVQNEINPHGPLLKAGMYARVTLPTGAKLTGTLVPKDAIVLGGPSPMVYVIDAAKPTTPSQVKVSVAPVQLGVASKGLIQVVGPIKADQLVVVQGNERIMPGQEVTLVRVVEPEAIPPVKTAAAISAP